MRNNQFRAANVHEHRRSIGGTGTAPFPFLFAAGEIVGDDGAVIPSAELSNDQPVSRDWRTRWKETGPRLELIFAPQLLAGGGIKAGNHSAHADGHDLSIRDGGRTARAGKTS